MTTFWRISCNQPIIQSLSHINLLNKHAEKNPWVWKNAGKHPVNLAVITLKTFFIKTILNQFYLEKNSSLLAEFKHMNLFIQKDGTNVLVVVYKHFDTKRMGKMCLPYGAAQVNFKVVFV